MKQDETPPSKDPGTPDTALAKTVDFAVIVFIVISLCTLAGTILQAALDG